MKAVTGKPWDLEWVLSTPNTHMDQKHYQAWRARLRELSDLPEPAEGTRPTILITGSTDFFAKSVPWWQQDEIFGLAIGKHPEYDFVIRTKRPEGIQECMAVYFTGLGASYPEDDLIGLLSEWFPNLTLEVIGEQGGES